jgi:hypothetical protein
MKETGLIYIADRLSWIPEIPARDLTPKEVKRFGKEYLLSTGLYVEKLSVKEKVKEAINGERN